MSVDVYAFASNSLTNIWAAVGAQMWAIPDRPSSFGSSSGKAAKIPLGAFGLLYSSLDKCFTVPFVVLSKPDPAPESAVSHVWEGRWLLPFRIKTLGNPHARISWSEAKTLLPSCQNGMQLKSLIHIEPLTVFAASKLDEADWAVLMQRLAN